MKPALTIHDAPDQMPILQRHAFNGGAYSYRAGIPQHQNPYVATAERKAWIDGWKAQQAADSQESR